MPTFDKVSLIKVAFIYAPVRSALTVFKANGYDLETFQIATDGFKRYRWLELQSMLRVTIHM